MGIEPTPSAWEAEVLPLNYTRFGIPRDLTQVTVKERNPDVSDKIQPLQGWRPQAIADLSGGNPIHSGIRQLSGSAIALSQRGGLPRPVQVFSGSAGLRYFGLPGLRLRPV